MKETKAKGKHSNRKRKTFSNSISNDSTRPTLTNFKTQPVADAAVAAIVSELQHGWDVHDAGISDRDSSTVQILALSFESPACFR
jgi:hypothetical protein